MTHGVPVSRPISWLATIPQFAAMFGAIALAWMLTGSITSGVFYGIPPYLAYSLCSRWLLLRAHRRGIRLMHEHIFAEAIREFEASYAFLSRYRWLDDYRCVFLMSPAAMTYREMALINIAFSYSQLGDGAKTVEYYRRTLNEFPENQMARAALSMIESVTRSDTA